MQCWITYRASLDWLHVIEFAVMYFGVVLNGCTTEKPSGDNPHIGDVVLGILDLEVADTPGNSPHRRLGGSPALVLDIQKNDEGETWYRLLGADGSHGWSSRVPSRGFPAYVEMDDVTLVMLDRAPDDPLAEDVRSIEIEGNKVVSVVGASRQSRVPSLQQLMIPNHLNPFDTPWLKLHTDFVTGWRSPSDLSLNWDESSITESEGNLAVLNRLGMSGLVREPFLGPIHKFLQNLGPHPGDATLRLSFEGDRWGQSTWASSDLKDAEVLVRFADSAPNAIGMLVIFPARLKDFDGAANVLTFIASNGKSAHAVIESYYSLIVTNAARADLNRDNLSEWLLETVQIYGDGYYSTLWIVDGRSLVDSLRIHTLELGGSSGEGNAVDVDAFWWVDGDNKEKVSRIWLVRTGPDSVEAIPFSYNRDRVILSAPGKRVFAVIVAEASTYFKAHQKSLSFAHKTSQNLPVFAVRKDGSQRWMVGRIFEQRREAANWMKTLGDHLYQLQIIELPVGSER